ncbi:hypothetical protein BHQ21_25470 [Mycobacterium sherrisii]|uniref:Uncharacterized protein n=1 Tax=Mycobacterium sherrisii TaxID=243061 RepID=A0A1E3SAL4_9MYCO|nr:hypothetical protein BHQ21_25470 [Mycobacterium sherrisii]
MAARALVFFAVLLVVLPAAVPLLFRVPVLACLVVDVRPGALPAVPLLAIFVAPLVFFAVPLVIFHAAVPFLVRAVVLACLVVDVRPGALFRLPLLVFFVMARPLLRHNFGGPFGSRGVAGLSCSGCSPRHGDSQTSWCGGFPP